MGKSSGGGGNDYGSLMAAMAAQQAAQMQYDLGMNQLNWAKDVYNQNYPYIKQGTEQSLEAQKHQNEFAKSQMDFYNSSYKPLEAEYLEKAKNWDTEESQQQQAGFAQQSVASQFAQARNAASQQLESFGVDPTSTRYAALDLGSRTQQAAAAAGAGTAAIQNRQLQGLQLQSGAINTGRGYASSVPAAFGSGSQSGAAAANGVTSFYGTGANAMNGANVWFQSGNQSMGNAITGYNNYYKNTYPEQQQSGSSGIGAGIGLIGSIISKFEDGGSVQHALPAPSAVPPSQNVVPSQASPSAGRNVDDVDAKLNVGEFVIPKEVVQWEGEKAIYKMVERAKQERAQNAATTETKPQAIPAAPGPTTYHSPGATQARHALPR